jgi:hypothetical protein
MGTHRSAPGLNPGAQRRQHLPFQGPKMRHKSVKHIRKSTQTPAKRFFLLSASGLRCTAKGTRAPAAPPFVTPCKIRGTHPTGPCGSGIDIFPVRVRSGLPSSHPWVTAEVQHRGAAGMDRPARLLYMFCSGASMMLPAFPPRVRGPHRAVAEPRAGALPSAARRRTPRLANRGTT